MQSQTINLKPQPISTTLLCIERFDLCAISLFSLSTPSSPHSSLSSCSVRLVETRQKHLVQVLSLHFEPLLIQNENRSHWIVFQVMELLEMVEVQLTVKFHGGASACDQTTWGNNMILSYFSLVHCLI